MAEGRSELVEQPPPRPRDAGAARAPATRLLVICDQGDPCRGRLDGGASPGRAGARENPLCRSSPNDFPRVKLSSVIARKRQFFKEVNM